MTRGRTSREEYLANSLSRLRPWEAEGISRATYYRRLRRGAETGAHEIGGIGARHSETSVATAPPSETYPQKRDETGDVRRNSRGNAAPAAGDAQPLDWWREPVPGWPVWLEIRNIARDEIVRIQLNGENH
jgi:hypothetical protein